MEFEESTDPETGLFQLIPKDTGIKREPPQAIDKTNTRVESLIQLLGETDGKSIIWARFRAEIQEIVRRIREEFGPASVVEYHGGIDNERRSDAVLRFQSDPDCKFFIGHVQAGGKGLTLHAATTVVYFSNDFSLENRLQSEDRAHRIGQHHNVTYIDFIAAGTLDEKVVKALREKKSIADIINGDEPLESWI
jgi:SNF2 family DNA or RNA helicase